MTRLAHIDLLRVALTVGVIATHATITYGGPGTWFYQEGALPDGVRIAVSIPIAFGALFGMGAFFFVAGAFLPGSLSRKGPRRFVAGRALRLGLPLLAFVLVVVPIVVWTVHAVAGPPRTFGQIVTDQLTELDPGPLWFVWVLLLFSTVVAVLPLRPATPGPLRPSLLVACGAFIAVASFLFRVFCRVDSYQIGAAHMWQWGQCIGLFALGVVAGRQGWLPAIPATIRRTCAGLALAGLICVAAVIALMGDDLDPAGGGWHWQSALIAILEGVICVSATIVLADLFRGVRTGRFPDSLIRSAYGAYILQTPVLVALALVLRGVPMPNAAKLAIVLPAALAASFGLTLLLLRIRPLARVL
ncbi:acyltransferase family protein [Paractinoplanes globisporus]|uniref:Acyltransferase n=1 Tax=Paractinoplanes globisporus TaxID=113565 RepID=A0ABW6W469_9ACTN|nr:acyltransferase [Actinoplanes globisporus]